MISPAALLVVFFGHSPCIVPPQTCLVEAARSQIGITVRYDGSYTRIPYPGGDIPPDRGVCTDVIVRAYRHLGVDLQVLIHEDMLRAWGSYPRLWRLAGPDSNIDHRRVPNLSTFFSRHAQALPVSSDPRAFLPGDVVTWRLPSELPHIGIVSDRRSESGVPLVIHNIGAGAREEDILLLFTVTGHYRYFPGRRQ